MPKASSIYRGAKRRAADGRAPKRKRQRSPVPLLILLLAAAVTWVFILGPGRGTLLSRFARVGSVQQGSVEVTASGEGLILRAESVYKAPVQGEVMVLLPEGERVRVGSPVVEVVSPSLLEELEAQVSSIRQDLAGFQAQDALRLSSLKDEALRLDRELIAAATGLQDALKGGDTTAIQKAWKHLERLYREREEKAASVASLEERLRTLLEDESQVVRQMEEASSVMEARETGCVSYAVDGLEALLDPGSGTEVTAATVYQADPQPAPIMTGDSVEAGAPLFKIVDVGSIRLALALQVQDALALAKKGEFLVRLLEPGSATFRVRAHEVGKKTGDDYAVITLEPLEFKEDLVTARRVKAEAILETLDGTLIPRGALAEVSGIEGVYVVEKATARFWPVTILGATGDSVVIEGISPGTSIVLTPFLVKDGSTVR
ncbi:MAG: HlyD family efflux transporter periplasmic adaptor subunit [Bacillota bacterium]